MAEYDYVFGANILENLTTGMYQDSKVIYREYIQNACDQIDKAITEGLLNSDEGMIRIWLNDENRSISIEDNATGIKADDFIRILGNIADSDKKVGEDKGFRGIGRLCGLAYCRELIFTSTAKGEDVISIMRCDAAKMRKLIDENVQGKKYTAKEVLNAINDFGRQPTTEIDAHWFKVELIGINNENIDLLDFQQIKDYLSFVAPVKYHSSFIFKSEIYKYAKKLGYKIDEYNIKLNGELILKKYKTSFKTSKGDDVIFDVAFKEIKDTNGNLLAWLWLGVSHFKAVITKGCQMRGLRLRKENIQIGDEDALQKLFKEDRGNHYFIGEVFAVAKELIPNSQRDYFNENEIRLRFERELRRYFNEELSRIYYEGSAINSAFKKIETFEKKEADFNKKENAGEFIDTRHRNNELAEIEKAKVEAEKAKAVIEKKKQSTGSDVSVVTSRIIERLENEHIKNTSDINDTGTKKKPPKKTNNTWLSDKFSSYNKHEKKLISKILGIIVSTTDKDTAETIIHRIEDEL